MDHNPYKSPTKSSVSPSSLLMFQATAVKVFLVAGLIGFIFTLLSAFIALSLRETRELLVTLACVTVTLACVSTAAWIRHHRRKHLVTSIVFLAASLAIIAVYEATSGSPTVPWLHP